jgi:hypothetical protein
MRATGAARVLVDEEADPIAELAGQPGPRRRRPERAERLRVRPVRLGYRRLYQATKRVRSRAFWSRFTAIVDSSVAHRNGDRVIRKRRLAARTPSLCPRICRSRCLFVPVRAAAGPFPASDRDKVVGHGEEAGVNHLVVAREQEHVMEVLSHLRPEALA